MSGSIRDLGLEEKLMRKIRDRGNQPRFCVRTTELLSFTNPISYQVVDTHKHIDKVMGEFGTFQDAQDVADQLNIKGIALYGFHKPRR